MESPIPSQDLVPMDARRPLRGRLGLSITALAAGLVNLVGGTTLLKAWVFNAGQTYYDALLTAFSLPPGVITLPEAMVTATGYEVFRKNTETWLQLAIFCIPLLCLIAIAFLALEWLLDKTFGVAFPKAYSGVKFFGDWFARVYLVVALILSPALLFGVFWLGIYKYPAVAEAAGKQRHDDLVKLTAQACAKCPMWNTGVSGVAIISDSKTALIATKDGVVSISTADMRQSKPKASKKK